MKKWKVVSRVHDGLASARIETIEANTIDQLLTFWRDGLSEDGFKEGEVDLVCIIALYPKSKKPETHARN